MGLVRQSAIEMARPNKNLGLKYPIRVNAVSPTFTDTALTRPLLKYDKVNKMIKDSNTTGELARKKRCCKCSYIFMFNYLGQLLE